MSDAEIPVDDLVTWLLDQVAQDEQLAQDALDKTTYSNRFIRGQMVKVENRPSAWASRAVVWPPARVLAECEAKRRLMERGGPFCDCYEGNPPMDPSTNWTVPIPHHYDCSAYEAAKVLAAPYDERPGYRERWRP